MIHDKKVTPNLWPNFTYSSHTTLASHEKGMIHHKKVAGMGNPEPLAELYIFLANHRHKS